MKTLKLFKNRRGVSAVISNLILIAAVIAVGFTVLVWSQTQSSNYTNMYGNAIKSDTDQLRERLAFEYIHYDSTSLTVYLMNSGTIGDVSIASVYVDNVSYASPTLAPGTNFPVTVVTGRGSSFVATFAT
jgi:flagellar biosynthesis/type III secretory pathway M-ring protein FliF/YscJ